jgi:hypothetical protein
VDESVRDSTRSTSESDLYRWLGYGAFAAVAATLLSIVSSALTLGGWPQGGFGLPEIIYVTALIPLGVVLGAYYKVSLQTGTPALRRSALGLFGMLVVLELASLNISEGEPRWWNVVIWVVLALVTGLFLVIVWNLVEIEKESGEDIPDTKAEQQANDEPAAPTSGGTPGGAAPPGGGWSAGTPGKATGAVLGILAAIGLLVLKAGARAAGRRVMKAMDATGAEAVVMIAILILAAVFLGWFAVTKIRLRQVLGPLAGAAGLVELLVILLFGLMMAGTFRDMFQAVERAGFNEQAAEANVKAVVAAWTQRAELGSIVLSGVWAALTVGLFLSYRGRLGVHHHGAAPLGDALRAEPGAARDRRRT